ncbi:hypothetical protein U5U50_01565 [Mycoplasma sp. 888]|uniref:hypothetical protein n=1 Tax=Mycoplasma sp. 888 TaxID=3108483 RepID=UPI002D76FE79|nr:hypothetical protein [Mycoplasma sp. 888]WRQ26070.1 hypothetical protein U5U50_01565 [Mycoplasma sp. 888]
MKKNRKMLMILGLLAGSTLSLGTVSAIVQQSVSWTDVNKASSIDDPNTSLRLEDWMADVDGNKLLSDLSIPGTHDSAMFDGKGPAWTFGKAWARTQYKNFKNQLKMGIRFFDIRLNQENFVIHGSAYSNNVSLRSVLSEFRTFLRNHPNETVLMRIKDENVSASSLSEAQCENWRKLINKQLSEYRDILYSNTTGTNRINPTLNELRGKVFVINNFHHKISTDNSYGIFWRNGDIYWVRQDEYNTKEEEKKKWFENMLDNFQNDDYEYYSLINFLSRANGEQPWWTSKQLNPWFLNKLKEKDNKWEQLGIVPLDAPGDSLTLAIVRKNYMYSQRTINRGILGKQLSSVPIEKLIDNSSTIQLTQPMQGYFLEVYKNDKFQEKIKINDTNTKIKLNNNFVLNDKIKLVFYKETPTNIYYPTAKRILTVQNTYTVSPNEEYVKKIRSINEEYSKFLKQLKNTTYQNLIKNQINLVIRKSNTILNQPMTSENEKWANLYNNNKEDLFRKINILKTIYDDKLKSEINTFNSSVSFDNPQLTFITSDLKEKLSFDNYEIFQKPIKSIPELTGYQDAIDFYTNKKKKLDGFKTVLNGLSDYSDLFEKKVVELNLNSLQVNYQDKKIQLDENIKSIQDLIKEVINNDSSIDFISTQSRLENFYNNCTRIIDSLVELKKQKEQELYKERLKAALKKSESQKVSINYLFDNSNGANQILQLIKEINQELLSSNITEAKVSNIEERIESAIDILNGESNLEKIKKSISSSKYIQQNILNQKLSDLANKTSFSEAKALEAEVLQLNNSEHQKINEMINGLVNLSNKPQKENIRSTIEQLKNREQINLIIENATKLNKFNTEIKRFESTKSTINYIYASSGLQEKYNNAWDAANKLKVTNTFNTSVKNLDQVLNNLILANNNLDGQNNLSNKKTQSKRDVDNLLFLSNSQKVNIKTKINKLDSMNSIDSMLNNATDLNKALEQLKNANDQLITPNYLESTKTFQDQLNLSRSEIDKIKEWSDFSRAIPNISTLKSNLEKAITNLDGSKRLNDAKVAAKTYVASLNSLSVEQKKSAYRYIDNSTSINSVTNIKDNTTSFNNALSVLTIANNTVNTDEYLYALDPERNSFNLSRSEMNKIKDWSDFNRPVPNVDTLKSNLEKAIANLDGSKRLNDAKVAAKLSIELLNSLSVEQKKSAYRYIDNSASINSVTNIKDNATKLDDALTVLSTANLKLRTIDHLQSSKEIKQNFEQALAKLNEIKSETNFEKPIDQIEKISSNLTKATNDLDGASRLKVAKTNAISTIENMSCLDNFQTTLIKIQIDSLNDIESINKIKDNAQTINNAIEKIKQAESLKLTDDYSQADQTIQNPLNEAINQLKLFNLEDQIISTDIDPNLDSKIQMLDNAISELENYSKLLKVKSDANDLIENSMLDQFKKELAKETIRAEQSIENIKNIQNYITKLNDVINIFNQAIKVQETINYKLASTDKKDAFNNAKQVIEVIKNVNDFNRSIENIDKLIDKLSSAINDLDGDNVLLQAKKDILNHIDSLTNLSNTQKESAKNQVNTAETKELLSKIKNNTTSVDELLSSLKEVKKSTNTINYSLASTEIKNNFDFVKSTAENYLTITNFSDDLINIDELKDKLLLANNSLDGENRLKSSKSAAIEEIKKLNNLSEEQKQSAENSINSAIDLELIETIKTNANNLNNLFVKLEEAEKIRTKGKYIESSDYKRTAFEISVTLINHYKNHNDFINPIDGLDQLLNDLIHDTQELDGDQRISSEITRVLKIIDSLSNLSEEQKQAVISDLKTSDEINKIKSIETIANDVDLALGKVKSANNLKSEVKYIEATNSKKIQFDNALDSIDDLKTKKDFKNSYVNLNEKLQTIESTKNELDGVQRFQEIKDNAKKAVKNLTNLTNTQKDNIKSAIQSANNRQEIENITNNSNILSEFIHEIEDIKSVKTSVNYLCSDLEKQKLFDTAKSNIEQIINSIENNPTIVVDNKDKLNNDLQTAIAKLDGEEKLNSSKNEAYSEIDLLNNLISTQKDEVKRLIGISSSINDIANIKDKAIKFNKSLDILIKANNQLSTPNYLEANSEKKAKFNEVRNNVDLIKETDDFIDLSVENIDQLINNLETQINNLDGDVLLNKAKSNAIDEINLLQNLEESQKTKAVSQINTKNKVSDIINIKSTVSNVDLLILKSKEANEKMLSIDYSEASKETKESFDAAKLAIDNIKTKQDFDVLIQDVEQLITNLNNATNSLDGKINLDNAKSEANKKLVDLSFLSSKQIAKAKKQINDVITIQKTEQIINNAIALNRTFEQIDFLGKIKKTSQYTEATQNLNKKVADKFSNLDKLREIDDFKELPTNIAQDIEELKNAIKSLDGDTRLQNEKAQAIKFVDEMKNLSKTQKEKAKETIDNKTTIGDIQTSKENIQKLNTAVELSIQSDSKLNEQSYLEASVIRKETFDKAKSNIDAVKNSENPAAQIDNIDAFIDDLKLAIKNLDGDKNLEETKISAKEFVNNLSFLTNTQKNNAIQEIERSTIKNSVAIIQNNVKLIDMLIQKIEESESKKSTVAYLEADELKKVDFNNSLDKLIDFKDTLDFNSISVDMKKLIDNFSEKENNLNGEEKLAKAKEDAKKAIDQLSYLSKEQKDAAKKSIDSANSTRTLDSIVLNSKEVDDVLSSLKELRKVKSEVKYKESNQEIKNRFNSELESLYTLLNEKLDFENSLDNSNNKLLKVNEAKDALNGENNLSDSIANAKDKINKLTNLTKPQKESALNQINTQNEILIINNIINNAILINLALKTLQNANNEQLTNNYSEASIQNKQNFSLAKSKLETIKDQNDFINPIENLETLINDLENAIVTLNGNFSLKQAKNDANSQIDVLKNLSKEQKDAAKKSIDSANSTRTLDSIVLNSKEVDDVLSSLKELQKVKSEVKYKESNQEIKNRFNSELESLYTLLNEKLDFENSLDNLNNKLLKVNEAKDALNGENNLSDSIANAKDKINKLTNLSEPQKEYALNQINSQNEISMINKIEENLQEINNALVVVNNAEATKNTTQFKEASQEKQTAFVNALEILQKLKAKNAFSTSVDRLDEKLNILKDALNNLDGDKVLADAKTKVNTAIDNLINLSDIEKAKAKELANFETSVIDVEKVLGNAKNVNNVLKVFGETQKVKSTPNYTEADNDKKEALDNALTYSNKLINELDFNNSSKDLNRKVNAVIEAKKSLNGDANLARSKKDANAQIDALENLSKEQKQEAKDKINSKVSIIDVNKVLEEAKRSHVQNDKNMPTEIKNNSKFPMWVIGIIVGIGVAISSVVGWFIKKKRK